MSTAETLHEMLHERATASPDVVALKVATTGELVTYGQLWDRSDRVAAGLEALGLTRGDTIAVWLPNGIEWVVLEFAAARLGVLMVALNPRYKVAEVAHLLGVAQARVLVFTPTFHGIDFGAMVEEALATADNAAVSRLVVVDGDGWRSTVDLPVTSYSDLCAAAPPSGEAAGRPEDLVNVFGTSGTTSFPKLATHDQAAVVRHARETALALEYTIAESVLCFLPFCGAYGFITLTSTLISGARGVIVPVYTPQEAVALIPAEGITSVLALEAGIRTLFDVEGLQAAAFGSWVKGGIAGLNVEALVERAEREFGIALTNLYGSSELFAMMACWGLSEPATARAVPGGRMVGAHMFARAVDPQTREVLDEGVSGEIEFSGYNVTAGYLSNPTANEAAFAPDGWYRSSDRGATLEGGRAVRYEGRLADTLRLRGYLVSPTEIEDLLLSHELVIDAQVVGVPNPATGEDRAVAFVKVTMAADDLEPRLREFCRGKAASWKTPDAIAVVEDYPTTPSANGEKVQKGRLREMGSDLLAERDAIGVKGT